LSLKLVLEHTFSWPAFDPQTQPHAEGALPNLQVKVHNFDLVEIVDGLQYLHHVERSFLLIQVFLLQYIIKQLSSIESGGKERDRRGE
jgi:hypothetical protein